MGTNPDDGPPFNRLHTVKGFPYNAQSASQDDNGSIYEQPASTKNSSKITLKGFFKGSGKSGKPAKTDKPSKSNKSGKADNTTDKKVGMWQFPENLAPPSPMDILKIMEASPEHQAKLAAEKAKKEAELKRKENISNPGHSEASQSTDSVIISPATDMKFSFDGKSVFNYKDPGKSQFHARQGEPGTPLPQGVWPGQLAIPYSTYQSEIMPRMGNEVYAPTGGPAVWSNIQVVGAFGASPPNGNPSQEAHNPQPESSEPPYRLIDMSNLRSVYEIAEAAYVYSRPGSKDEWMVYLNDYRAGLFNMINLPQHPPIAPLFSFLPAMDPLNEEGRMLSLCKLAREWTTWQEYRSREIVKASMAEFGVTGVSISLMDKSHEIFKAEIGYNCRMIKRSESIAAHVLLTTEVLVVLDTRKDWRFAKNPLVVNDPKIRFFAGAPILSDNCEVLGVFAVFGCEPRDSFSALQRRSLADYGGMCATELNTVEKSFSEQSLQSLQSQANTEIWDPTYLHDEPKPRIRSLWMHEETHRMLCGEPREGETEPVKYPTSFGELMEQVGIQPMDEDTLNFSEKQPEEPYLNGAQANFTYSSIDVNFSTPAKDRDTVALDYPLLGGDNEGLDSPPRRSSTSSSEFIWEPESDLPADYPARPESPIMRSCKTRPYSGSDLTSVDGNLHPNTPTEREGEELRPSPSQRVQATLDRTTSVLRSESLELHVRRQRKVSIRSISKYEEELKRNIENSLLEAYHPTKQVADSNSTVATESFNTSEQPSTQATTPLTLFNTRMSTLEFADTHRRPEADAAATSVAKNLGFNRIYVAEIFPNSDLFTPEGVAITGMGVRILASYNCPSDIVLETDLHLQVLRSPLGAIRWHDKDALPGASNKGLLIRLHSKGPYGVPRQFHTGGIVYGAFHVAQSQDGEDSGITDKEQAALVDAANAMKLILFKKSDKRDRKDSAGNKPSSHMGNDTKPAPAVETEVAGPVHSNPAPTVEATETEEAEHPHSISREAMKAAAKAVAEVLNFNMEDEMSPQW